MRVDVHTHILPGIDDGAKNVDESLELINELKKQGIDLIVATPHFYADIDGIKNFLKKRNEAYVQLKEHLPDVDILKGAEVTYFKGISKSDQLDEFVIEGTNIMLIEMPFSTWRGSEIKEIKAMIKEGRYRIMLAHLERFYNSKNKSYIKELLEEDILVQINAASFVEGKVRHIKKVIKKGATVLGSDTHNMSSRPPMFVEARKIIEKKLGQETLKDMDETCERIFGK